MAAAPPSSDPSALDDLVAAVLAQDESGALLFSDLQIRDFIASVLLQLSAQSALPPLPPNLQRVLVDLGARAGVHDADPPDEVQRKLIAYWAANPVPPALARRFGRALRDLVAAGSNDPGSAALAALGAVVSKRPLQSNEPRPAGTLPGGLAGLIAAKAGRPPKPDDDT